MKTIVRFARISLYGTLVAIMFCGCGQTAGTSNRASEAATSGGSTYAYVSLDSAQCIAVYHIDPAIGELQLVKKIDAGGMPGSLAVDPTNSFLYAAIRSTNCIASFRINAANGDLIHIGTIQAAGNPVYLRTDKTGKYLLSAYFADSKAAIYPIGDNGAASQNAVSIFTTEKNAHSIQTDPTNQFLFIPCRTGETIHQFMFNQGDGTLKPNAPDRVATPTNTGPRHFAFHPKLPIVYFVNEFGNSVSVFRLETLRGTLTHEQTLTTLPSDFVGRSAAADVHLTPDGRFLYASNRGHESIAAFSVDMMTGQLTSLGIFATEKTPRSFIIDQTGRFLYAAGQSSGRIAAYRINHENGKLNLLKSYDVGKNPVWILTIQLTQKR
jgi:6-phosphogluconolactonase